MANPPSIPIQLQIRKIIQERFNDQETRFTNDEIFDIMKKTGGVDDSWTIDDLEPFFNDICHSGLARNIAQNFTTIWMKLTDDVEKLHCSSCGNDVCLGVTEKRVCPNPSCNSTI